LGVTPSAWASGTKAFDIGSGSALFNPGSSTLTWLMSNAYNNGTNFIYKNTGAAGYYSVGNAHSWHTAASGTAGNAITFTQAMTLNASGNLGISTTSPTQTISVGLTSGTKGFNIVYTPSSAELAAFTANASTGEVRIGATAATYFPTFYSNGSEAARIDSSGNLLIGTTSQISTGFFCLSFANNARNGIVINDTDTGGGTNSAVIFRRNGSQVGSIVTTTSTTALVGTSDYRLKNSIAPMTGALSKVIALKPCTYKWNSDGSDGEGFIAHELQSVIPDAVIGEKDALNDDGSIKAQGINTNFLIPTLVKAIQEMKSIIDDQAARIATLEAK
jgi:hypothetical protein